ncbi:Alkyl hydroperoxide reductase subunit F [bacterium HR17]|uniref:Alkyl hydroperoxide reductase subunit F n=1 Tax=Candidatus Fervidibacter japonicus TaxID=2035412 RepID=A0A2H5XAM1_9BACT|nr:Alkyl hydroperoxide reductase subunit F [bacterium HR17]
MALLSERDRKKLQEFFNSHMVRPVKLVLFTQAQRLVWTPWSQPCQFCKETEQLVRELVDLSPLIAADIHDFDRESALAERYSVDKVPALIVSDESGRSNIRYFGIPAGMEFTALIEDIVMVSQGKTNLSADVQAKIRAVDRPVHIQVFVTPTCPYCPRAVRIAHQFALENPRITADMVEATEFPDLAERYRVLAVPKVVINDKVSFEGALPEHLFALYVLKAVDQLGRDDADEFEAVDRQLRAMRGDAEDERYHHDEFEHEHHFHRYEH